MFHYVIDLSDGETVKVFRNMLAMPTSLLLYSLIRASLAISRAPCPPGSWIIPLQNLLERLAIVTAPPEALTSVSELLQRSWVGEYISGEPPRLVTFSWRTPLQNLSDKAGECPEVEMYCRSPESLSEKSVRASPEISGW